MGGVESAPARAPSKGSRALTAADPERAALVRHGDDDTSSMSPADSSSDIASGGGALLSPQRVVGRFGASAPTSVSSAPVTPLYTTVERDLASEPDTPPQLHGTRLAGTYVPLLGATDYQAATDSQTVVKSASAPGAHLQALPVDRPVRMLIVMSDTGGGHRASAQAIETAFNQMYPAQAEITTVDFWTSVAGFPFHRFPAQYTYLAKRPLLWYLVYLWAQFPPTRWLTETAFSVFCFRKVRRYFEAADADVIISVHPLVNTLSLSVLTYMRRISPRPVPPYVTIVTDLGGAHPTWFDRRADLVYVPSEPLRQVAEQSGIDADRIRLFGLPIRSSFWTEARSRDELRVELGMALDMPAVLLVGGGDGVGGLGAIALAIAHRIAQEVGDGAGQLVVVCGKNKKLLHELRSQSWPIPVILKGFVSNMSEWMSACDILCSKAGPGTIAEGWSRGLPIIITGYLPGQEEGNVKLVTESGSGEYHGTPEGIAECAARWVGDPELRGGLAGRARALGRPNSTREIAGDVWTLTRARKVERDAFFARAALRPAPIVPNGYLAMARFYIGNGFRLLRRSLLTAGGRGDPLLSRPQ